MAYGVIKPDEIVSVRWAEMCEREAAEWSDGYAAGARRGHCDGVRQAARLLRKWGRGDARIEQLVRELGRFANERQAAQERKAGLR